MKEINILFYCSFIRRLLNYSTKVIIVKYSSSNRADEISFGNINKNSRYLNINSHISNFEKTNFHINSLNQYKYKIKQLKNSLLVLFPLYKKLLKFITSKDFFNENYLITPKTIKTVNFSKKSSRWLVLFYFFSRPSIPYPRPYPLKNTPYWVFKSPTS